MSRMEPPPIASWILEHCIPGQRDQALAGDLLEEFQGGRSHGWYWRQALAAVLVGWIKYLGNRSSLIVFAVLWSMLAPAWAAVVDRMQVRDAPWPLEVAVWLGLSLAFVWTGMLLFACLHRQLAQAAGARKLARAFGVAAGVFLPAYVATFVLANLFLWPGLGQHLRGASPLSEIADLRLWADALRLPYFITILGSMWSVAPLMAATPVALGDWNSTRAYPFEDVAGESVPRDPHRVKRMLALMVAAGLLNALIAGLVLCRLPAAHHPTLQAVLLRAIVYVGLGAVAGIVGTYLYWHNPASSFRSDPPLPFPLFALVCAAGWVWVPAIILFSEQVSALSAGVAMLGAFLLAGEIRRLTILVLPPAQEAYSNRNVADTPLFAETLCRAPAEPDGYLLALGLYGAGWAIAEQSNMTAAVLLAMAACLFKLRTTHLQDCRFREAREFRRAALRFAGVMLPAVLVTFWALLDGVAHRNRLAEVNAGLEGARSAGDHTKPKKDDKTSAHVGSGYESVVLWPYPPKKQIVAPVQPAPLLAPGTRQPVVIRFNGEYWYLQPPDVRPGPQAHRATGTPLDVHIASANSLPLMMQAHQYLRSPIAIARCREIRVEVENRETEPGSIVLAVWLKSSSAADARAVYLGEQPITSAGTVNGSPVAETLAFAIPAVGKVRAFDQISVMMLPESGHQQVGPRVAIEQFEVVPR
jgi:hypothetical protein